MTTADICVIVPTIREYDCVEAYVRNAEAHGFDTDRLRFVLVTEDFCDTDGMERMLADLDVEGRVFDGSARQAWYESNGVERFAHVVPAASHAETSFGLLYMWDREFPYGVFIDDDTRPHESIDFFGEHLGTLNFVGELRSVGSDSRWVNVLYEHGDGSLYPRGYPYAAMDERIELGRSNVDHVVASQGLWTNVPDLDAVRILMDGDLRGQAQTRTTASDFGEDFVADRGDYLTVCSMNLAFRREVIPAFYQFPMDDNPWDVGRFDDIWSGIVLKRACDVLGGRIVNGSPLCEHNKAPRSTFDDLQNEVAGLELNEHFFEIVDAVGDAADSYADVAEAVGRQLADGEWDEYTNGEFLTFAGEYMLDWLACLEALSGESARKPIAVSDD
ncbi:MAG: alpha-1 4-glucan-protein synthase [Halobacteriota archaeon]